MASLADRLVRLMRSPEARRLADKAEKVARDPQNRRRLAALRHRLSRTR